MKAKLIMLMPWKWQGVITTDCTLDQHRAFVKRDMGVEIEPRAAGTIGHAYVCSDQPWCLWASDIKNIPMLAHEVFHVTTGVLEARGMKLTNDSEEAYTYTLEYIMAEALKPKGWTAVKARSK